MIDPTRDHAERPERPATSTGGVLVAFLRRSGRAPLDPAPADMLATLEILR